MNALTQIETEIEACFTNVRLNFIRLAELIVKVRDEKIYADAFPSFEKWCEDGMGWTKRRANQLIAGAATVEDLPPSLAIEVKTEYEARELGKLSREDQKTVIRESKKEGISIAEKAKTFSENAGTIGRKPGTIVPAAKNGEPKPDIRLDSIGREIPRDMIEEWDRAAAMGNRLRACASEIKMTVERGLADKDPIFGEITNPTIAEAASLHYTLSQIMPYSVCPGCQGRNRKNCLLCRRRGWISKYLFQSPAVSSETKAILERARK